MQTSSHKAAIASRWILGAGFLVFGLNGFLQFLPQPPLNPEAGSFIGALAATGYMFPLIKGTEVIAGALLLANRFVPLALTVLAPIVVNIIAFHLFLSPAGTAVPLLLLAAQLYLAWHHREAFMPMLRARAESGRTGERSAQAPRGEAITA